MSEQHQASISDTKARFHDTCWSEILIAANKESTDSKRALEELCKSYWPPLYAFIRRRGYSPADSQDFTQGFFEDLLSRDGLQSVRPTKGRFRTFLLACLENFLNNKHAKSRTRMRGGSNPLLPIDEMEAEERYRLLPAGITDPAKILDRVWANIVIEQVLREMKTRHTARGKAAAFEALQPFLIGDAERGDYATVAVQLQMTEVAARKAAHGLRAEFRQLLVREIRRTVDNSAEVEPEIRELFRLFAG